MQLKMGSVDGKAKIKTFEVFHFTAINFVYLHFSFRIRQLASSSSSDCHGSWNH